MIAPLELPDAPRWIEAHGMAADPASWRRALGFVKVDELWVAA